MSETIELAHTVYDYYVVFCQKSLQAKLTSGWIYPPPQKHKAFAIARLLKVGLIKSKGSGKNIVYAKTGSTATVKAKDYGPDGYRGGRKLGSKNKPKTNQLIPVESTANEATLFHEPLAQAQPVSRGRHVPTIWQWSNFIKAFESTSQAINGERSQKLEKELAQWTMALGAAINNDERHRAIRELARLDNEYYDIGSRKTIDAIKVVAAKPEFREFHIEDLISLDPDRYVTL